VLFRSLQHRGDPAEADDLLQETFVRAYVHLEKYRGPWRFSTWLFTIARRVSINQHRRRRPECDGRAIESAASPVPGPAEMAVQRDSRQYLWARAAEALSEVEQTAMWLHYVEEMPVGEIAAVLDCSRVAVKTMMFRARRKLLPFVKELAYG
jgi:RNA polymerase sigma-70 factor, ECF subfamily